MEPPPPSAPRDSPISRPTGRTRGDTVLALLGEGAGGRTVACLPPAGCPRVRWGDPARAPPGAAGGCACARGPDGRPVVGSVRRRAGSAAEQAGHEPATGRGGLLGVGVAGAAVGARDAGHDLVDVLAATGPGGPAA